MPRKSQRGKTGNSRAKSIEKPKRNPVRKRASKTKAVEEEEIILGDLNDSDSGTSSDSSTWSEFGERILTRGIGTGSRSVPELKKPEEPVKKRAKTNPSRLPPSLIQNSEIRVKQELDNAGSTSTLPHVQTRVSNPPELPNESQIKKPFSNLYTNVKNLAEAPSPQDPFRFNLRPQTSAKPLQDLRSSLSRIERSYNVIQVRQKLPKPPLLPFRCPAIGCSLSFKSVSDLEVHCELAHVPPPRKKTQIESSSIQKSSILSKKTQLATKSNNISAERNGSIIHIGSMAKPAQNVEIKQEPDVEESEFQTEPLHCNELDHLEINPVDSSQLSNDIKPLSSPPGPDLLRFESPGELSTAHEAPLDTPGSIPQGLDKDRSSNVIPRRLRKILPKYSQNSAFPFQCKVHGYASFNNPQDLESHQNSHPKKASSKVEIPDSKITGTHENELFSCTFPGCTKIYDKKDSLRTHNRVHKPKKAPKPEDPSICEKCGKSFKYQILLKRHLKNTNCNSNKPQKIFTCNFQGCDREFKTIGHWKIHLDKHVGVYKFLCEFCGGGYPSKSAYKDHQVVAHLDHLPPEERDQNEARLVKVRATRNKHKEALKKKKEKLRENETEEERQERRKKDQERYKKFYENRGEMVREYARNYRKGELKTKVLTEEEKEARKSKIKEYGNARGRVRPIYYYCDVEGCGEVFKLKKILQDHQRTHKIYMYSCEFCGAGQPSKTHWENHKVWVHWDLLPPEIQEQNEARLVKLKEAKARHKEDYRKKQEKLRENETEEERQKRREYYKELRIRYIEKNPEKMREYYNNYQKGYLKRKMQNEEDKKALFTKRNEYQRQRWAKMSLEERRRKNSKKTERSPMPKGRPSKGSRVDQIN